MANRYGLPRLRAQAAPAGGLCCRHRRRQARRARTRYVPGLIRTSIGADDGIRTRDPHLGKVVVPVRLLRPRPLTWSPVRRFVSAQAAQPAHSVYRSITARQLTQCPDLRCMVDWVGAAWRMSRSRAATEGACGAGVACEEGPGDYGRGGIE